MCQKHTQGTVEISMASDHVTVLTFEYLLLLITLFQTQRQMNDFHSGQWKTIHHASLHHDRKGAKIKLSTRVSCFHHSWSELELIYILEHLSDAFVERDLQ